MLLTARVASILIAPVLLWSGRTPPHRPIGRIPLTLTFAPSTLVGGTATTLTVTLGTPAPGGGANVTITNPPGTTVQAGAAQVGTIQSIGSTKIKIDGGQQSISFRVLTAGVAASTVATFTASSGNDQATATLTVNPASLVAVSVAPATMLGGTGATGTVTLDGPAPAGTGATIQLTGTVAATTSLSDGSVRSVSASSPFLPTSVSVAPGASSATFAVTTTPVALDQTINVSAVLASSTRSTTFVVKAPIVTAVLLNPSTVVAGNSSTGTVVLNGPAPATGLRSPLSASNTNATVPTSVTVPPGSDRQTFQITTPSLSTFGTAGNTVSISTRATTGGTLPSISDGTSNTISIGQTTTPSAILTLLPKPVPVLATFTLRPTTVTGGLNLIASLQLSPGITTAQVVSLSTDQPDHIVLPATVTVPVSSVPTSFTFKTVHFATQTIATVTAIAGSQRIPIVVTIVP